MPGESTNIITRPPLPPLAKGGSSAIIVFEKKPRWEAELKRELSRDKTRVRAVRTTRAILPLVRELPGSVVVLDFDAAPADCLRLIGTLSETSSALPVAIASPALAELEWTARELGAVAFLPVTITGERLARLCARLLRVAAHG